MSTLHVWYTKLKWSMDVLLRFYERHAFICALHKETKLLFDEQTGRILGGGIVGTHAGDMIGEVALAIEMGADAVDIGRTIHPHPTLGESIGLAAEVAEGVCTDVPPARKR